MWLMIAGSSVGTLIGGVAIDALESRGYPQPFTAVMIGTKCVAFTALPMLVVAGLRFERDREWLMGRGCAMRGSADGVKAERSR